LNNRKSLPGYLVLNIISLIISLSALFYQTGIFDLSRLNPLVIKDKIYERIYERKLCDSARFKILVSKDAILQDNFSYIVNKNGRIVNIDKKNGMYVFYANDYKIKNNAPYLILTFMDIRNSRNFFPDFDCQSFLLNKNEYKIF